MLDRNRLQKSAWTNGASCVKCFHYYSTLFMEIYGLISLHVISLTFSENVLSITPLEIYLLTKLVICSILILYIV